MSLLGMIIMGKKHFYMKKHEKESIFWENEHNFVANTLLDLKSSSEITKILDLPSGTGRFYNLYENLQVNYIGGDSSIDMLNEAKKSLKNNLYGEQIQMFSTKINLPDNSVDVIVCFRFLQWIISIADVKKTLKEFHRVSRKFCLLEFCVGDEPSKIETLDHNLTLWNKLNYENLEILLKSHGFKIINSEVLGNDEENPNLTGFLCEKENVI